MLLFLLLRREESDGEGAHWPERVLGTYISAMLFESSLWFIAWLLCFLGEYSWATSHSILALQLPGIVS
jgi:hypothetical protein